MRGVAALMVVWFHVFEAFATSHVDQRINHGYLAVDFFFILSGFVIGYAYDDRWKRMTVREFVTRRFIRLHPMVVIGAVIGAVMFYFQGCSVWDVSKVSVTMLLAATLMNACMIPATPGMEIRGVTEMFPLNGPSWSLFYEYIGNILYALFIRRLPTKVLAALALAAAMASSSDFQSLKSAAGGVLICAGFAVGVGVCLFWQPAAFLRIWRYFLDNPAMIAVLLASIALALVYILAGPLGIRDFFRKKKLPRTP